MYIETTKLQEGFFGTLGKIGNAFGSLAARELRIAAGEKKKRHLGI
jgi:hypothetical protein